MTRIKIKKVLLLIVLLVSAIISNAQISAPLAISQKEIYTNESVYIFCAKDGGSTVGSLTAQSYTGENSSFSWEIYDTLSNVFVPFEGDISIEDSLHSVISDLGNGLYRVTIHSGGTVKEFQSHVINNWIKVTKAEIPDSSSNCVGFKILAAYTYAPLSYYDLQTKTWEKIKRKNSGAFTLEWYEGTDLVSNNLVSTELSPLIYPPIASKSPIKYTLLIKDEYNCDVQGSVDYYSKVPKSNFTADPMDGEAVLKVTFTNKSINYDSILWYFYKDDAIIKQEVAVNKGKAVDSIDFVLTQDAPVYEYEKCGKYKVKLVTVHINTTGNCYDTLYMQSGTYINVDTSLVEVPNVFTPNGDGMNDNFVVKSKSLKSLSIHIYNRWGGLVHSWSYSDIRSRDYTYEHSVWDGKIGNRMASPGVYFYIIRAVGRDDKTINKEGFLHLFRNKN